MKMQLSLEDDDLEMRHFLELESKVNEASPYRLIAMLYEGAIQYVLLAKTFMEQNDQWAKDEAIGKAIAIIDEGLVVALNGEVGSDIPQNLKSLYDYMSFKLLQANFQNNAAALDEVANLLGVLKVTWDELGDLPEVKAS